MPERSRSPTRLVLPCAVILAPLVCGPLWAQPPAPQLPPQPEKSAIADGLDRTAGTESSSAIQYTRLILRGSLHSPATAQLTAQDAPPILIAQCSLLPEGKYLFEFFANFGGPADLAFYPPWKPTRPGEHPPPAPEKFSVTMDFLGYTHVKPLRREWEIPLVTPSLYYYNPPGVHSANLEEASWILRYLLSLPTLRLTLGDRVAEFNTTPLQAAIRKEPLCRASGL